MKLDLEKYFGNYTKNNTELLIKLIKILNTKVEPYSNPGKPFFKGGYVLSYYEYLKECELNYKPSSPEDVMSYLAPLFQNVPNWNNPGTMINAIPPVNLVGLASVAYSSMHNPNLVQDTFCGLLMAAELEMVKYVSELTGWDWEKSYGIFTTGGFGTNLYPAKIALTKACPDGASVGYEKGRYFMVTSAKAHPCHREIFGLLGIGAENCIALPCDPDDRINIEKAEEIISTNIEKGRVFIGFNMNGGSTAEYTVDPIKEVYSMRERLVSKYQLKYRPHIHVDSVIGWAWLFFNRYNFSENLLNFRKESLTKIYSMNRKISELIYADSFGADFHKTGFCPYTSSLFIVKNREDYFLLGKNKEVPLKSLQFGSYCPFETSFEYSRSAAGPISALATIKSFGVEGFQSLIGNLVEVTDIFRSQLAKEESFIIINQETCGIATLFILKPRKYASLSLEQILKLPEAELIEIKNYNVGFAKFVLECNKDDRISFTFTASRSYEIPGTTIRLGAIKAYPMSVYLDEREADGLVSEIIEIKNEYKNHYSRIAFEPESHNHLDPTWH